MILTYLLLGAAAIGADTGQVCAATLRAYLASVDSAYGSTIASASAAADRIDGLRVPVVRFPGNACRPQDRPTAALWDQIVAVSRNIDQSNAEFLALDEAARGANQTVATIVGEIIQSASARAQAENEIGTTLRRLRTVDDSMLGESLRNLSVCEDTTRSTISREVRTLTQKCIRWAVEELLRQQNHDFKNELQFMEATFLQAGRARGEVAPATPSPPAERLVNVLPTTTIARTWMVASRQRELSGARDRLAALRAQLEESIDRRPTIVPFLSGGAAAHAGGGLLLRPSAPTWTDRTPFVFAASAYPSGTRTRTAGEGLIGRLYGDAALLAGVVGRTGPDPVGGSIVALYMPRRQAPAVGVRVSTLDPVSLLIGWGIGRSFVP